MLHCIKKIKSKNNFIPSLRLKRGRDAVTLNYQQQLEQPKTQFSCIKNTKYAIKTVL